jgi:16S rRNA processing protein RimM
MLVSGKHVSFVVIGKIGRPHQLEGENRLYIYTKDVETALSYGQWWVKKASESSYYPLIDEKIYRLRPNKLIIKIPKINTKQQAERYSNALIGIPRNAMPELEEDEFYWVDLIDMHVVNHFQEYLGRVDDLIRTGANDVLLVKAFAQDDETTSMRYIPFVDQYVSQVDHNNRRIIVEWYTDYD